MLDELTKTFFDTFEIEPKLDCKRCGAMNFALGQCAEVSCKKTYPQITPDILLELICILTRWHLDECEPYEIMSINIEQLKNQILSNSLYIAKHLTAKQQVQSLFKEG